MSSRQQDPAPSISPVLFSTVKGEPMSFFSRPGPLKRQSQPLITAGGGILCKVQQPGAISLIDPEEKSSIPESTAHWYVSTQYIHDCIEKEEQSDLDDYRLNPEKIKRSSPRLNSSRGSPAGLSGGRLAYTPEDDAAILSFISERVAETGGNRLWKDMEKQRVTSHSWQSMKHRYKEKSAKKQPTSAVVGAKEESNKSPEKTETKFTSESESEKSSRDPTPVATTTNSAESDLTQIDVQSVPAASTPEHVETAIAACVTVEESQTAEEQPSINIQSESTEGETSHCCQPEEEADHQMSPETLEPEGNGPSTAVLPQKDNSPKSLPPSELKLSPKISSPERPKEKSEASLEQGQQQRRLTRRQSELEALSSSPEPYGKKSRSASSTTERSTSSSLPSRKAKSAVKSANQRTQITEEPCQKKARGKKASAEAESQVEQSSHDAETKMTLPEEASSAPQNAAKKKEKRPSGILEMATKEFEDDSESDEDECPDLLSNAETVASSSDAPQPSDTSADPPCAHFNPETGPNPKIPETQASSVSGVQKTGSLDAGPARTPVSDPICAFSKAHLFIFDSESQQDDSQSMVGESSAAPNHPQPSADKDAAFSLTQTQLEEDKQRIRESMNQTNQDSVSVTKALLKTSGDFSAAANLLLNPSSVSAPFWNRHDDSSLLSSDPIVRQKLQEKYGEENVAKRIVFLEVEG